LRLLVAEGTVTDCRKNCEVLKISFDFCGKYGIFKMSPFDDIGTGKFLHQIRQRFLATIPKRNKNVFHRHILEEDEKE
jgi:hypothetical protein